MRTPLHLGLAWIACACTTVVDYRGEDQTVFPDLRLRTDVGAGEAPRPHETRHAVELAATTGSGEDSQVLAPGERVVLDGQSLSGPLVEGDFELRRFSLAYRPSRLFEGGWRVEGVLGAAVLESRLRLRSGARTVEDDQLGGGALVGLRLGHVPTESVELYGEFSVVQGASGGELTRLDDVALGLAVRLARHLSLDLGHRWWSYRREAEALESGVQLDLRGPFLALTISF